MTQDQLPRSSVDNQSALSPEGAVVTSAQARDRQNRLRVAQLPAQPAGHRGYAGLKRTFDIVVGSAALVLSLPAIALIAVLIRMQSPGPPIFRQQRVVQGGRTITFYKFRTMYVDAPQRFPQLYAYDTTVDRFAASYYKPAEDPRNTPLGGRIRKLTLDELPNLFNVVRGEVSLVGPRPELPEYLAYYTDEQLLKFTVPAGITGLAQVSGRNELTVKAQIDADLDYVRRRSFWFDLHLIGRTVTAIVGRAGAQ